MANDQTKFENLREFGAGECQVLVVDDDPDCLAEFQELISALGYICQPVGDAGMALRTIASDPRIGIVITDLNMPGFDGLTLLDEISQRFLPERPLVPIVVTGESSLDNAVRAMRSNAVDFLTKPIDPALLSTALRNATARWFRVAAQFKIIALSGKGGDAHADNDGPSDAKPPSLPSPDELQRFATQIMKARQKLHGYFSSENLSGPDWDILLDLAVAGLKGEAVPTSSACASTHAPLSTALRHVNRLVEVGLVIRRTDTSDKRRTLLELEPKALDLMTRYLASTLEVLDTPSR